MTTNSYNYFGDEFDIQLFRVICTLSILIALNAIIHNVVAEAPLLILSIHTSVFLSLSGILIWSRYASQYLPLVTLYILLLVGFVIVQWFLVGGINSPMQATTIGILVATAVLVPHKYRLPFIVMYISMMVLLTVVEKGFPQYFPVNIPTHSLQNIPFNWVLVAVGISGIIFYNRKVHEVEKIKLKRYNTLISEKQRKIEIQNRELKEQQQEIALINETLEKRVLDRTMILEKAIDQLHEYAFINSHLLRAPVARIQGLIELLKYEKSGENKEVIDLLNQECETLEVVVGKISIALNKGAFSRDELYIEKEFKSLHSAGAVFTL